MTLVRPGIDIVRDILNVESHAIELYGGLNYSYTVFVVDGEGIASTPIIAHLMTDSISE